jgi:Kef-type K+ transport system membrane component KefB
MDLRKINTVVGQQIISVAIFDDVLALSILGVLLSLKGTDMSMNLVLTAGAISVFKLALFGGILTLVYFVIRRILRKGDYIQESLDKLVALLRGKEPLHALFFAFVLLFATFTEILGLHFIVGAFFAALLISDSLIGKDNLRVIEKTTSNMAMGFLAPIFFAGIGLEFNIGSIHNLGLMGGILLASYASKIVGGYLGGRLAGMRHRASLTLGIGLNARGIMELVIANIAYKNGMISTELFSILVLMGVLTTLTTPVMLKKAFGR